MVGRTPWSAADAPVGLLVASKILMLLFGMRDGGVPRGPGSPPPQARYGVLDWGAAK
jgi:hypothetical protein